MNGFALSFLVEFWWSQSARATIFLPNLFTYIKYMSGKSVTLNGNKGLIISFIFVLDTVTFFMLYRTIIDFFLQLLIEYIAL